MSREPSPMDTVADNLHAIADKVGNFIGEACDGNPALIRAVLRELLFQFELTSRLEIIDILAAKKEAKAAAQPKENSHEPNPEKESGER